MQPIMTCPLDKLRIVLGPNEIFPLREDQLHSIKQLRKGEQVMTVAAIAMDFTHHPRICVHLRPCPGKPV